MNRAWPTRIWSILLSAQCIHSSTNHLNFVLVMYASVCHRYPSDE